jgi:putative ABC transport system permease protein
MDTLRQDIAYALRTLRRSPGFALVAIVTLALGIGANSAIFSVVNSVLLRPLPYAEPERLVMVWGTYPNFGQTSTSLPDFRDFQAQSTTFEHLTALTSTSSNLSIAGGEPERVGRVIATANFFQTLGVRPHAGRFFLPEDEQGTGTAVSAAQPVAVISHRLWQSRLGGSPNVVGREIFLHGRPFTVVGVAPAGFRFGEEADVWTPLNLAATNGRRSEFLDVVGRTRPGVALEQVRTEMRTINRRLAEQYPETNSTIGVEVTSLHEEVVGTLRPALLALMGAVGLVLLIACANVANLMLTRAAAREREMAIRAALGAGRGRIVRQLLTESVVVALLGAAMGLLLATAGIEALRSARAELIPRFAEVRMDPWVLAFTVGLAVVTGLLFGLAPAVQLKRRALSGALRSGGRGMAGASGARRLRSALVLSEVALALMLLVGAGLLIRSFNRLQQVDVGFDPKGVLTAQVALPAAQYAEEAQQRAFFERLLEGLSSAPGVQSAALVSNVPLSGSAGYWSFEIEGVPDPAPGSIVDTQPFTATPEYFGTMRIPLLAGRMFSSQDHAEAPPVAIINREMARRYWEDRSPIGARITYGNPADTATQWMTIVGVVGDTRVTGLTDGPYPQTYVPAAQTGASSMVVALRTSGDPTRLAGTVRRVVSELDPTLPVFEVKTMEQWLSQMIAQPRVGTTLLGVFAAIALILAAVGIYGLISYTVAQRTAEIGVRMALGAQPRDVLRLMVQQGMKPALAGIAVGIVGAWAATRLIQSLLFGVSPTDPLTFLAVVLFLAATALLAAYLPARRATRVDPMIALRAE